MQIVDMMFGEQESPVPSGPEHVELLQSDASSSALEAIGTALGAEKAEETLRLFSGLLSSGIYGMLEAIEETFGFPNWV